MTYFGRKVFEFPIDWSDQVSGSFTYDLHGLAIGFGFPFYERTQQHIVRGWAFGVTCQDEAEIQAVDDWVSALGGRRIGFWLPVPWEAGIISDGVDATNFKIQGEGLGDSWQDGPLVHLYFTKPGQTAKAARVIGVTGTTEETIEVHTTITVDETWKVWKLLFVRLAEDGVSARFLAEGAQKKSFRVLELPQEVATATPGTIPVWLYHFTQDHGNGTVSEWRYTSFDEDLAYASQTWNSHQINHGEIADSVSGDNPETTISTVYSASNPLSQFPRLQFQSGINVAIYQGVYSSGSATSVSLLFTGRVINVSLNGALVNAACAGLFDFNNRRFPRHTIGPKCPFIVFEPNTCRAAKGPYQKVGTLTLGATPNQCTVTAASLAGVPVNWFAGGLLTTGTGANVEQRTILASSAPSGNDVTLSLGWPLILASNGQSTTLLPGCNGLIDGDCLTKYDNIVNHGGHPHVPGRNLSIQAMETSNPRGNKK